MIGKYMIDDVPSYGGLDAGRNIENYQKYHKEIEDLRRK